MSQRTALTFVIAVGFTGMLSPILATAQQITGTPASPSAAAGRTAIR